MNIFKTLKDVIVKLLVAFMIGFAKSLGYSKYKEENKNKHNIESDK